jgi:NCAIR mutase (PurE)-related protein
MDVEKLRELLDDFKHGRTSEADVLERLRTLPFEDFGFAKVDHHRSLRRGFPEVVYGAGKTVPRFFPSRSPSSIRDQPARDTVRAGSG